MTPTWEQKQSEVLYRLESTSKKLDRIDERLVKIERHLGILQVKVYVGACILSSMCALALKFI